MRLPTHIIIARAAAVDPEGENLETRVTVASAPDAEALINSRKAVIAMFQAAFKCDPMRVGVAVLPWIAELDDPHGEEFPRAADEDDE